MSVMGTRVQRREDPAFLTGANRYVADLRDPHLEGALHVHFVRSTMAHARLTEVDVSEAVEAPGVVAVYTAADTDGADDLGPFGVAIPGMIPDALARSWITGDVVRFVGDVVAVIVAESKEQAEDAAELVIVDYDPLDAVVDPVEAEKGELLLFPEHGSNVASRCRSATAATSCSRAARSWSTAPSPTSAWRCARSSPADCRPRGPTADSSCGSPPRRPTG